MYFDFAEASERVVFNATVDRIVSASNDAGKCRTSQAEKSAGWMPRRQRPMKDAETGETWQGELQASDEPVESEWGNPRPCERADRPLNA